MQKNLDQHLTNRIRSAYPDATVFLWTEDGSEVPVRFVLERPGKVDVRLGRDWHTARAAIKLVVDAMQPEKATVKQEPEAKPEDEQKAREEWDSTRWGKR